MPGLFKQISKFFKNILSLKYFFSFKLASCQKVVNKVFFEDLYIVIFCDEINF
jgi:hypothetical protein